MRTIFNIVLCTMISLSAVGQDYSPMKVESCSSLKGGKTPKWTMNDTRIVDSLHGFKAVEVTAQNEYGSDCTKRYEATGFFYAVKDGNRWWMVDPYGYRNLNIAVVGVRPGKSDRNKSQFKSKFGDEKRWIANTVDTLQSLGFYGSGSWSEDSLVREFDKENETQFTYTPMLNFMARYGEKRGGTYQRPGNIGYPNQTIFVFDPQFEIFCDEQAQQLVQYRDDKNLVGYFSDNEMPLTLENLEGYLSLPNPDDPGRKAAEAWLEEQHITRDQITDAHRAAFVGLVAERYYSIVSKAIKRYDPNHMFLGSRLHGKPKYIKEVIEAAGRYCDVVSINYYGSWTPDQELMRNWGEWAQKPFVITEFYTKGMDSGLANTSGAGFAVRTQQDRGYAYQHFTLGLLESGNCVGWHWFRYQDNDPTAKGVDPSNVDSNKGLVDNNYEVYQPLARLMKQLNMNVYELARYFDAHK